MFKAIAGCYVKHWLTDMKKLEMHLLVNSISCNIKIGKSRMSKLKTVCINSDILNNKQTKNPLHFSMRKISKEVQKSKGQ